MYELNYYEIYKNCKDISFLRKKIINSVNEIGIKPTAKKFNTTVKTVKKWIKRFLSDNNIDFKDYSKRPKNSPRKIMLFYEFKIKDFCEKIIENKKRVTAKKIKEECTIPYSIPTILKVMKKYGFKKINKKKKERKKDLREYKKKYKAFEKIQVDIKYLTDIPELYSELVLHKLPKYQYTARCIRTGAIFISYADEKSISNSITFITKLLLHLKKFNVKLEGYKIQTDNGREFTNGFRERESDFTKIIEKICKMYHRRIPPKAKTYQSDVETSHRLIEDEFYCYERFYSKNDFYDKAYKYVEYFNLKRFNSYKNGSPKDILKELCPEINEEVLLFKPIYLDDEVDIYKNYLKQLAS